VTECIKFGPEIQQAATDNNVDATSLAAVAAQETGGPGTDVGSNIVGDGGHGHGLFQIDDRWHPFANIPDAMDPGKNAEFAAGMLAGLLAQYGGDWHEALSAYNDGTGDALGSATLWPDGKTLYYADSVTRHISDSKSHDANLACGSSS
jgi:hypothetical protein